MRDARAVISAAIQEAEDCEVETLKPAEAARGGAAPKAFVVHGHDNEMKETVARFLERLGIEPIILHEQASRGDTIVEKMERNADVALAIVLLSPDDVGAAKSDVANLKPRARQNVILELGYFVGRLTRRRVVPVLRSKLELPSDVLGVTYISFDSGEWKLQIIRELKAVNVSVDANKAF
jgi:predicted nucleotide-binding protein